jgi:hypothetical protein
MEPVAIIINSFKSGEIVGIPVFSDSQCNVWEEAEPGASESTRSILRSMGGRQGTKALESGNLQQWLEHRPHGFGDDLLSFSGRMQAVGLVELGMSADAFQ